jgi:ribonuclease HI
MAATKFSVYADGSSGGNSTGAIGWGWVVLQDDQVLCAGNGGHPTGTNNVAELMGAREGLRALLSHPAFVAMQGKVYSIELVSDSQYVLGLANGAFSATKNVALAQHVREICVKAIVSTRWVRGHAGHPINEMCDKLAKAGKYQFAPPKKSNRGATRRARRKAVDKKLEEP